MLCKTVAGFKNDDFFKGQKNRTQKSDSYEIFSLRRQIFGQFLNLIFAFEDMKRQPNQQFTDDFLICFCKVVWLFFRERLRFPHIFESLQLPA